MSTPTLLTTLRYGWSSSGDGWLAMGDGKSLSSWLMFLGYARQVRTPLQLTLCLFGDISNNPSAATLFVITLVSYVHASHAL